MVDQVAGVWKDGETDSGGSVKDIQVFTKSGHNRIKNYYYGAYDSLQYPLLYPMGEPGWDQDIHKVVIYLIILRLQISVYVQVGL